MSKTKAPPQIPVDEAGVTTEQLATLARAWKQLGAEERRARLEAASERFAGGSRTVDDFLREKHQETDREEAAWGAREKQRRKKAPGNPKGE